MSECPASSNSALASVVRATAAPGPVRRQRRRSPSSSRSSAAAVEASGRGAGADGSSADAVEASGRTAADGSSAVAVGASERAGAAGSSAVAVEAASSWVAAFKPSKETERAPAAANRRRLARWRTTRPIAAIVESGRFSRASRSKARIARARLRRFRFARARKIVSILAAWWRAEASLVVLRHPDELSGRSAPPTGRCSSSGEELYVRAAAARY
jgi:hypothetical protein